MAGRHRRRGRCGCCGHAGAGGGRGTHPVDCHAGGWRRRHLHHTLGAWRECNATLRRGTRARARTGGNCCHETGLYGGAWGAGRLAAAGATESAGCWVQCAGCWAADAGTAARACTAGQAAHPGHPPSQRALRSACALLQEAPGCRRYLAMQLVVPAGPADACGPDAAYRVIALANTTAGYRATATATRVVLLPATASPSPPPPPRLPRAGLLRR